MKYLLNYTWTIQFRFVSAILIYGFIVLWPVLTRVARTLTSEVNIPLEIIKLSI